MKVDAEEHPPAADPIPLVAGQEAPREQDIVVRGNELLTKDRHAHEFFITVLARVFFAMRRHYNVSGKRKYALRGDVGTAGKKHRMMAGIYNIHGYGSPVPPLVS